MTFFVLFFSQIHICHDRTDGAQGIDDNEEDDNDDIHNCDCAFADDVHGESGDTDRYEGESLSAMKEGALREQEGPLRERHPNIVFYFKPDDDILTLTVNPMAETETETEKKTEELDGRMMRGDGIHDGKDYVEDEEKMKKMNYFNHEGISSVDKDDDDENDKENENEKENKSGNDPCSGKTRRQSEEASEEEEEDTRRRQRQQRQRRQLRSVTSFEDDDEDHGVFRRQHRIKHVASVNIIAFQNNDDEGLGVGRGSIDDSGLVSASSNGSSPITTQIKSVVKIAGGGGGDGVFGYNAPAACNSEEMTTTKNCALAKSFSTFSNIQEASYPPTPDGQTDNHNHNHDEYDEDDADEMNGRRSNKSKKIKSSMSTPTRTRTSTAWSTWFLAASSGMDELCAK